MKKLIYISILLIMAACTASTNKSAFTQVEYFKSDAKERVFCIYTTSTNKEEISKYANTLMNTSGRMTTAFFYNEKSKIKGITGLKSHDAALDRALTTDFFARYDKYPTGKTNLTFK